MIEVLVDGLSWGLLACGALACVISAIGMHRMPEFYSRCHAAGVGDSFGAALILVALMLQAEDPLITIKLVFVLAFLLFTSPISTHALVKAAYAHGIKVGPEAGGEVDTATS